MMKAHNNREAGDITMGNSSTTEAISALSNLLAGSENIVFFGGAGVSTESGIPDFRSDQGIFNTKKVYGYSPETIISRSFFLSRPELFYKYYRENFISQSAEPNAAHKALARLEEAGKLKAVVTQNVDGLHQAAGSRNVLELHGSVLRNYCMSCLENYEDTVITDTEGIPKCPKCGGMVRPDVVLYEEGLDGSIMEDSVNFIAEADVLIVGGTSLSVYPAAGLIRYYVGKKLVLINKGATSFDSKADLHIRDSIGVVLGEAVDRMGL
jgi:NAD-dependent deacetylase